MSCPYFEPTEPTSEPVFRNARLPLIEQYDGFCHAHPELVHSTESCCNHGYARGQCERLPAEEKNKAHRFSLIRQGPDELELLFIGEEEYSPVFSRQLHFSVAGNCLKEHDLDCCVAAQAVAFCRSYLGKIAYTADA